MTCLMYGTIFLSTDICTSAAHHIRRDIGITQQRRFPDLPRSCILLQLFSAAVWSMACVRADLSTGLSGLPGFLGVLLGVVAR